MKVQICKLGLEKSSWAKIQPARLLAMAMLTQYIKHPLILKTCSTGNCVNLSWQKDAQTMNILTIHHFSLLLPDQGWFWDLGLLV